MKKWMQRLFGNEPSHQPFYIKSWPTMSGYLLLVSSDEKKWKPVIEFTVGVSQHRNKLQFIRRDTEAQVMKFQQVFHSMDDVDEFELDQIAIMMATKPTYK